MVRHAKQAKVSRSPLQVSTFCGKCGETQTPNPCRLPILHLQNLLNFDWQRHIGLGGHNQWRPVPKPGAASNNTPPTAMLTTDVALLKVSRTCACVCSVIVCTNIHN